MTQPMAHPDFGAELRRLRNEHGLSLRALAARVHHGKSYLHELETGQKRPLASVAWRLDNALTAGGALAALVEQAVPAVQTDLDRVRYAGQRFRAIDPGALDALAEILAHLRRLEDTVGAAPLMPAVGEHLRTVTGLADQAHGPLRREVVDLAGQWAQFAGWLHAATDQPDRARHWYGRTLEYATDATNNNLAATALSMLGHLAWLARQPGAVIGLSAAAGRHAASPGVQALAEQQQARGHALCGDAENVQRHLDRAVALAEQAAEHPDREPRWVYFHSPQYLTMQRGLACRLLGRHDDAIAHLTAGLAALQVHVRRSEFVTAYVLHLVDAHHDAGNDDEARRLLDEVRAVSAATGSARHAREVDRLTRRLGL